MHDLIPSLILNAESEGVVINNILPRVEDYRRLQFGFSDNAGSGAERMPYEDRLFCSLPWEQLFITANGLVTISGEADCYGVLDRGLNERSLLDIWNGKQIISCRKKILKGEVHDICDPRCISGVIARKTRGLF